jgi:hypothetical protein
MDLSQLLAREAIRDLVARYNAYGDSGLFDRMIGLFARDATLELQAGTYTGHDEIRAVFAGVQERSSEGGTRPPAYLRHCTSTHQIDLVDEDRATGRLYFFVITGIGLDHWGRYLDDYRRVDGTWRFARRRVLVDDLHPGSAFRT